MSAVAGTVLRIEQRGAVRELVLDRPRQRNALDAALVDALTAALADAEHDPATRAVLVTGQARASARARTCSTCSGCPRLASRPYPSCAQSPT